MGFKSRSATSTDSVGIFIGYVAITYLFFYNFTENFVLVETVVNKALYFFD